MRVSLEFNLIQERSHPSRTLPRSRFRDSATVTLTFGDGTTAINVESSALPISLFSIMERSYDVNRRNNNGPKTLSCSTPDTTLTVNNCTYIYNTEPSIHTEKSHGKEFLDG